MKNGKLTILKNAILPILAITFVISAVSCGSAGGGVNTASGEISAADRETSDDNDNDAAHAPGNAPADAQFKVELNTSKGVFTIRRTLQYGDEGDEVSALWQKLADLGYLSGVSKESFDYDVYWALMDFERDTGLYPDGIADEMTLRALK